MRASVRVPVLSVHSTSMAPRSWMAASRFTITRFSAMRMAPRDKVTVMTIGNSSGVRPTASARANRNDSSAGRPKPKCTSRTKSTKKLVRRRINRPRR